ncbi:MAG: hypothetical protein WC687_05145 [Patescibacteria group bacterium]
MYNPIIAKKNLMIFAKIIQGLFLVSIFGWVILSILREINQPMHDVIWFHWQ